MQIYLPKAEMLEFNNQIIKIMPSTNKLTVNLPNTNFNFKIRIMKNTGGLLAVFERNSISKLVLIVIAFFTSYFGFSQTETDLYPSHDAYLQNGVRFNDETLRVESGSRVRESYIKFDLSGIVGTITALELELTVYTDPGTGTISVYQGIGDIWTELNLSNANKPSTSSTPIGTFAGSHAEGAKKVLSIDPNILNGDNLTFVIKHSTNSDVAFASKGPETASIFNLAPQSKWPKLKVTYTEPSANDTQAPDYPTGLTVNSFDHESANISWNAASDNGGGSVAGYNIYINGALETTTSSTSYQFINLSAETAYQVAVAAYDDASPSNLGNQSALVHFTTSENTGGTGGSNDNNGYWIKPSGSDNIHYIAGNVGIGRTGSSSWTLDVLGKIRANEIKVEASGADYVFLKEYQLPTLDEVEQHIKENGYLINVPSAKEVQANGIELGQWNMMLLEKIEELTLYIIDQEKHITALEQKE